MLIIASMIEREVAVARERPLVASVIYNRLQGGHAPRHRRDRPVRGRRVEGGADGLRPGDRLALQHAQVRRACRPGPISNPGKDSIRAAARPVETPYLYYVARNDGTGRHYFSSTPEQFEQDVPAVARQPRRMIDGGTRVAGIIGWPVEHSLSPAMHNAAFAALGLNWTYVGLPGAARAAPSRPSRGLAAAGCAGLNATIPHKLAALRAASSASAAAVAIGAANTLVPDGDGGFRADNTDAAGFLRALDEQAPLDLAGADALVIGGGGAARAVVYALRSRGARVRVANRTPARAAELGDPVPFAPEALELVAGQSALVVNATSLGLAEPTAAARAAAGRPRPRAGGGRRRLPARRDAVAGGRRRPRGARTVDGLGMLLHQGAAAFAQWTGREPPLDAMRAALPGEVDGPPG